MRGLLGIRVFIVANSKSAALFGYITQRRCTGQSWAANAINRISPRTLSTILFLQLLLSLDLLLPAFQREVSQGLETFA